VGDISKLFPLVWPAIKTILDEPRGEQEVREYFDDLRLGQARDWLVMAVDRGLAVREERPVRYTLTEKESGEGTSPNSATSGQSYDSSSQPSGSTKTTDTGNGASHKKLRRDFEISSQDDSPTLFDEENE